MILKKVHGAAGTDYFTLLTSACPQFSIFNAPCRHAVSGKTG
ncbi:hypothetical protein [Ignatzschineria indica]|nr:hypothetical protein [Ignatzschineria indica]